MARKVESDEERLKRIYLIRDYALKQISEGKKISTRSISDYFSNNSYFKISNNTVSVYLNSLAKLDFDSYKLISEVINANKPKTINDSDVLERVKAVDKLLLGGHTVKEIADLLGETENTINRDINNRLVKVLDKETLEQIKIILTQHSLDNLVNNKQGKRN